MRKWYDVNVDGMTHRLYITQNQLSWLIHNKCVRSIRRV